VKALIQAAQGGDDDRFVFASCYSIFFFGVPNRGLEIASLMNMVKGQPNSQLVNNLGSQSHLLPDLEEQFYRQFIFKDSKVVSCFELKDTPPAEQSSALGILWKTGRPTRMVTKVSATRSAPREEFYDQLPIDADNSNMVKFSSQSEDYGTISRRIVSHVKEAPMVIGKRFMGYWQPSEVGSNCVAVLNAPDCQGFRERQVHRHTGGTLTLEESGTGRIMASGADEDERRAAQMDNWIARGQEERA